MNAQATTSGIGFFGALAILFIALKLMGIIDWTWWWVLAPLWVGPVFLGGLALIALVIYGLYFLFEWTRQAIRRRN